jgi:adenylate kinase family enzyme
VNKQYRPVPFEHPIGRRVVIWGRPGKTTLGKAIAQKYDIPFIEIDWVRFKPNWELRTKEEATAIVEMQLAESSGGWVYDGNPVFCPSVVTHADTIILIDMPWLTAFWTYLNRGIRRSWTGEEIAGGNRETFRLNFASTESHLCHIIKTRNRSFRKLLEPQISDGAGYYVIDSWKSLHSFYEIHQLPKKPSIASREAASSWLE